MAVVGKGFAVLQTGPLKLSGYFAWLAWAFIHIQFLALSSMRVSVFLQWIWTYFTGSRGSRLIVDHCASSPAKPSVTIHDQVSAASQNDNHTATQQSPAQAEPVQAGR